jgi:hypothetical protein
MNCEIYHAIVRVLKSFPARDGFNALRPWWCDVRDVYAVIMSAATLGQGSELSYMKGLRESYCCRGTRLVEANAAWSVLEKLLRVR